MIRNVTTKINMNNLNKRFSLNIMKKPSFSILNSQIKNTKMFGLEDLLKSEKKLDKTSFKKSIILKKQKLDFQEINTKRKLTYLSNIESKYSKFEMESLLDFKIKAYQKLKDKYIYIHKERFYFMKKEEIPTQYDYIQLTNLIERKKSLIFSQLNELFFFNNIQEYLRDIYNYKHSIIILKYLLYFIYDKDIITYVDRPDNEKNKKYIKSNYLKFSALQKEKNEIRKIGNIRESFNKYIKNDESIIFDLEKINNNIFISYNFTKVKYIYIYNVPLLKMHNCLPNLFPNGFKILNILKDFLNLKNNQKLFKNKIYSFKNSLINIKQSSKPKGKYHQNDSKKRKNKKNVEKYLFENSSIISNEENNNYNSNNDYYIHYHSNNNTRREKKDHDIVDIEQIIKNIYMDKTNKLTDLNEGIQNSNSNLGKYKKSLYHKKFISSSSSQINKMNFSQKNDKVYISDNSTNISNRLKIEKCNNLTKNKKNEIRNKILSYEDNKINNSFKFKNNNNEKNNSLILSSYNEKKFSSSKNINYKKNLLLSLQNIRIQKLNNINNKNNKEIKKIKIKIRENNFNKSKSKFNKVQNNNKNKYIFKDTKKFISNKKHKIIKYKKTKLKEFLNLKINLNNSNKEELKYSNSYNKGFEYFPEIFFLKNENKNIWERGEDFSTQKKCEHLNQHIMSNIRKYFIRNKKNLINSSTFKQIIKCGNIYERNFSFNYN